MNIWEFFGDYEVDLNKFLEKHEEKIKISKFKFHKVMFHL